MQVQIVFNPASGRYSPARVAKLAAAFVARGATVTTTSTGAGPVAVMATAEHLVVVGGDGTVRHVAYALAALERAPRLSVYAGGTVNLLAREWTGAHERRPRGMAAFAARVLAGDERPRFPIELDDGLFLSCAGAGWESVAVATVDVRLKRAIGRFAYAVSAVRSLVRWRPVGIVLVADGRTMACEGFHIAKGVHYAGRWRLADRMLGHEPVMQVVALRRARRRDLLRFWGALATGRSVAALPRVEVVECAVLIATADRAVPVQADGDLVGTLPMTFRVGERAIVLC